MLRFAVDELLQPVAYNTLEVRPLCLLGVEGLTGRRNDALFKPAVPSPMNTDLTIQPGTLVFFGGDVQDFIHLMDQDDPNIKYRKWCLEAAACRLGEDFPSHHIVVIKPSRKMFDHISCYDNFVDGSFIGIPKHLYFYKGLPHLEKLLQKISKKIKSMSSDQLFKMLLKRQEEEDYMSDDDPLDNVWQYATMSKVNKNMLFKWQKSLRLHKYPLTLVAFSKGCVVLNQFLYEFHYAKRFEPDENNKSYKIIDRIEAMYWLDANHPGRSNVYLTSRGLLKTLFDLNIEIHVHLSSYQMEDIMRPYVREQCKEFTDFFIGVKARIIIRGHDSPAGDLDSHFDVLMNFKEKEKMPVKPMQTAPENEQHPPPPPPPPRPWTSDRDNNLDKVVAHRDILGVALVSPHDSPYLALQMIMRKPKDGTKNPEETSEEDTSVDEDSAADSDSSDDESDSEMNSINCFQTPFNFVARNPSNSRPLNFLPQDPSIVAQNLSFPIQIPYNFAAEGHTTSAAPGRSASAAQLPSTSAYQGPSTYAYPGPSTSAFMGHSTSAFPGPSTSSFPGHSTSAFPGPSTSSFPGPSTSTFPGPSTSSGPSTSGTQNVNSINPKSRRKFAVLTSKKGMQIIMADDNEATRDNLSAHFFQLEGPVIATPSTVNPSGINVYSPVNEIYVPMTEYNPEAAGREEAERARPAVPFPPVAVHNGDDRASGLITIPADDAPAEALEPPVGSRSPQATQTTQTFREHVPFSPPEDAAMPPADAEMPQVEDTAPVEENPQPRDRPRHAPRTRRARNSNAAPYTTNRYNLRSSR